MRIRAFINQRHNLRSIEEQIWYELLEMMQEDYESIYTFSDAVIIKLKKYKTKQFDVKVVDGIMAITPANGKLAAFKAVEREVTNA